MLQICIPTACHEDWNAMSPNQLGRHCNACMKTVIDFTNMTDDEVKNHLLNKKEEQLCGRFTGRQLQRIRIELPSSIFQLQMPWWKRFLVASLFTFSTMLFSCEVKQMAPIEIAAPSTGIALNKSAVAAESIAERNSHDGYVGGIVFHYETDTVTIINSEMDTSYHNITMGISVPIFENPDSIKVSDPLDSLQPKLIIDSIKNKKNDSDSLNCADFS